MLINGVETKITITRLKALIGGGRIPTRNWTFVSTIE